ncbi:hypothetical protein FGB62_37g07 [Gracilaria domingensis]|nr:hypothetical protein FGB62_37g07 [Gracilaria domingensis]
MKRFYSGYGETSRSYMIELQVFMHPSFRKLSCLNHILPLEDAQSRRNQNVTDATHNASNSLEGNHRVWNFSEYADEEPLAPAAAPSLEEEVRAEIERYVTSERKARESGYPNLSQVAKAVLAHPASSAQIERDFGTAGALLTSTKSRLDSAFVDITLFLHCNMDSIPASVPTIPDGDWQSQIPKRLTAADELAANLLDDAMNVSGLVDPSGLDDFLSYDE